MAVCASCGAENREGARFCDACGSPLESGAQRETRKTVTVVFCDVTGSTAIGESTDPEALRGLLARYFERMKGIVEAHGGSVEKFIGDAVMAVFGVPLTHEDDALRACRAASEMRDAFPELGVSGRIGVNTGEVVTGTEERLATGDAVNVAARLEQAAAPGEALLGEATYRLVRAAVEVGERRLLELKGKSEPVAAYPLLAVTGELERRFATPMVGRENELLRLRAVFDQAVRDRSCQLFTVLGTAGVGKSRLAAELFSGLEARIVRGRCLSYGEGIAYWPVVEVLRQLGSLPEGDAARPLRALLGETDALGSGEEIAWGFRKLLEQEGQAQPLVCVLDDLHWAEETLLDLVEHVADLSREAPILLLCLARPELLERRPAWGGGKWNATTVLLEPLDGAETDLLLSELGDVPAELRERIVQAAEGNPLFLEEMLALVRDSGGRQVEVPPSIQALLAARLDQLDAAERDVLERGSIEGRTFHRGALVALTDGDGGIEQRLIALVRKELVRPDRTQLPGDDAYRFRHLLIRDAAYDALPKAVRADLHERFADWLQDMLAERRAEYEAVIGHHLEQAYRYRSELGRDDRLLAERAGRSLAEAGRLAEARGDAAGTVNLFTRAVELLPPADPERGELLVGIAHAAGPAGDLRRSQEAAQELIRLGRERGDARLEHIGRMQSVLVRTFADPSLRVEEIEETARAAIPVLEAAEDEASLAQAHRLLSSAYHVIGRTDQHIEALERALEHARRAGDTGHEAEIMGWLAVGYVFGMTPVEQAQSRLEQMRAEARAKSLLSVEGILLRFLGGLEGMRGNFDEARELFERGLVILADHGLREWVAGQTQLTAYVELLAGDPEAAERELRPGYDEYERMGETGVRSMHAAMLASVLLDQGRDDEAEGYVVISREITQAEDYTSQAAWRTAQARLLARRGELGEAERTAREAVALVQDRADAIATPSAWSGLGETLALAGKREEAEIAFAQAVQLEEQKGNTAGAARTRALAARLGLEAQ
ncbi:MAG TPA: adenylate/guanylate cyclase domain-containing protein [Gaiellaceae bacterium]|nr:adenylate/guanylate cyclase domain-containing protein [Gaiellaceae bacterium]